MKKFLYVAVTLVMLMLPSLGGHAIGTECDVRERTVYICDSSSAERYHKTKDCRGLRNCRHGIKEITLAEAERLGRTPCKICYK